MKGYAPDGMQTGINTAWYLARVDRFTEVMVIHNDTVQYNMLYVMDDSQGSAAVNRFQNLVKCSYIAKLKRYDHHLFGIQETG